MSGEMLMHPRHFFETPGGNVGMDRTDGTGKLAARYQGLAAA
jgi:hypothetical protein